MDCQKLKKKEEEEEGEEERRGRGEGREKEREGGEGERWFRLGWDWTGGSQLVLDSVGSVESVDS